MIMSTLTPGRIIFTFLAGAILFLIIYIYQKGLEKNRNPVAERIIDQFLYYTETITIRSEREPLKKGDVYFLPSPECIPVGYLREKNADGKWIDVEVEVVEVSKKIWKLKWKEKQKRYTHWGLFNNALHSGKKVILSHNFTDGLPYSEISKMKRALKEKNKEKQIYWLNIGDKFEEALKSDNIIFKSKD